MQPVAWLNGEFLPQSEARISPMDRGFLFADGIYEVVPVFAGKPLAIEQHLIRLTQSLESIQHPNPLSIEQWTTTIEQLIEKNGGGDIGVYIQVTRGSYQKRTHQFPPLENTQPTVFMTASSLPAFSAEAIGNGFHAITSDDFRWGRCDIKSVALLGHCMLRQQSFEQDAIETLLEKDGWLTEGTSSNVFLIKDGRLLTPKADLRILNGITRQLVIDLARQADIPVEIRDIHIEALFKADEVFITSSTKDLLPIVKIDNKTVANGQPGPIWEKLTQTYQQLKSQ
ncbi:D-amino acid aminotransferase [Pelagibaculum spongiae]|uniref:Aminodeoxychorismate lyase n=1 Tax=Pelagibaculum spongiae TaxID=2080658 RepID=A0A2V1H0C1_9GAMM|nr:D-amino acid aminotransferase [Pelagibaculum spongiae]PVZ72109.1 D-amino acid aminotransferase [Pelagibaculum spongiae]